MFWKKAEKPRYGVMVVNKAPEPPLRPTKSLWEQIAAQQPRTASAKHCCHCCCCCCKRKGKNT